MTLEGLSEEGPRHNAAPIVNVRHFPRLAKGRHDDPQVHELVRAISRDRVSSDVWEGASTLELDPAPGEEHDLLAPVEVGRGYRFSFGYTVDDLGEGAVSAHSASESVAVVAGHRVSPDHFIGGHRIGQPALRGPRPVDR